MDNMEEKNEHVNNEGNTNPSGPANSDASNIPSETSIPEVPTTPPVENSYQSMFASNLNLGFVNEKVMNAKQEISKYIIGQHEMIDLLLIGIFSNGHVLLEGVPGIAKTLTAKVLSKTLSVDFSRIQFTPDLMPSDVLGTSVFNMKDATFSFNKGPIFSNIVLIDEINRAPAKTQASLFEVMEERQITYDGTVYPMEFPFLVIATQNPVEQEGTYNLPEAQLDRFLFKIKLTYPTIKEELEILTRYKEEVKSPPLDAISGIFTAADIQKIQDTIGKIRIEDQLLNYIAEVIDKTRNHGKLYLGASPRASLSMLKASKAYACMRGRDFVIPDDIQYVAPHILNHRMILTPEAEMEGITVEEVIKEILQTIEVPR